jgi:hypothetical protein
MILRRRQIETEPSVTPAEPLRTRVASWVGILGISLSGGTLMSKMEYPGYAPPIPNFVLYGGLLVSLAALGYADQQTRSRDN